MKAFVIEEICAVGCTEKVNTAHADDAIVQTRCGHREAALKLLTGF